MEGIAPPLVTPFDKDGDVDHDRLAQLVDRLETAGVDFLVPCGSTSEAPLLTDAEREAVVETVAETANVPVMAGTGTPGFRATVETTRRAADAGAAASLVVTPFYYEHDQATLAAYYREVGDAVPIPVYLYSVPVFTGLALDPETVGSLAEHSNIEGLKDSSGDIENLVRTHQRVDDSFSLLVGSASVLSQGLAAGASGGINALANLTPGALAAVLAAHDDDTTHARELNAELVELNHAVTAEYGVPGLKWVMRERGFPAGYPRSPHASLEEDAKTRLRELLDELEL